MIDGENDADIIMLPDDWEDKYNKLKKNFDILDRYNDVLYKAYRSAYNYVQGAANDKPSSLALDELEIRLQDVRKFEDTLQKTRNK